MHAARWPILERRKIKGDGVVEIGVEGIERERHGWTEVVEEGQI
jgi:hypothetical protein